MAKLTRFDESGLPFIGQETRFIQVPGIRIGVSLVLTINGIYASTFNAHTDAPLVNLKGDMASKIDKTWDTLGPALNTAARNFYKDSLPAQQFAMVSGKIGVTARFHLGPCEIMMPEKVAAYLEESARIIKGVN